MRPVLMMICRRRGPPVSARTCSALTLPALPLRLRQPGIAGATAQAGMAGFGSRTHVRHKGLFGVSRDRPVAVACPDTEAKLREALPEIQAMVKAGLIVSLDAEQVPPG